MKADNDRPSIEDRLTRHCPRLGGSVDFQYCRSCGEDKLPCRLVMQCWWERFDIELYLKQHLSEEDYHKLMRSVFGAPKPKVTTLLELIENAKRNND